jgi:hypothetical protein
LREVVLHGQSATATLAKVQRLDVRESVRATVSHLLIRLPNLNSYAEL